MATPPPIPDRPAKAPLAIPARAHVFLIFMLQFIVVMVAFGVTVPALHSLGVPTAVLVVGSVVFLVGVHFVIALLGRLIPVRCGQCRARTRYYGFGWWPFTYHYVCRHCGHAMKYEIVGG